MRAIVFAAGVVAVLVAAWPAHASHKDWTRQIPWRLAEAQHVRGHTWSCESSAGLSRSAYPAVRWGLPVKARRYRTLMYWHSRLNVCRAHRSSGNPNVELGRRMATLYGWSTGVQWRSLYDLWNHESGWDNHAQNSSGACGIPQSMTSCFGYDPGAQIAWGLRYIKGRYGSPVAALGHFYAVNWY